LIEIWNIWRGSYLLSGIIKAVTGWPLGGGCHPTRPFGFLRACGAEPDGSAGEEPETGIGSRRAPAVPASSSLPHRIAACSGAPRAIRADYCVCSA
jgi:hypothetical protein